MRIGIRYPSWFSWVRSSRKYQRVTLWLSENCDWLIMVGIAILVLLGTVILTSNLPLPVRWTR